MAWKDEIVEEVRAAREAYAARFGYDLRRIFEDLKSRETEHPERWSKLRPLEPVAAEEQFTEED